MIKTNINNLIKVKLTKTGKEILKQQHMETFKNYSGIAEYEEPKIDENGYVEMQLWELMRAFGHYFYNGNPKPPMEMTFFIEIDDEI